MTEKDNYLFVECKLLFSRLGVGLFFFFSVCVIYSALPSNTRMSIFRKIALSARKIFKYVAENERRV